MRERQRAATSSVPRALFLALGAILLFACSGGDAPGEGSAGTAATFATLELEATYPEPFSFLSAVRELSDGSVMAADPLSQVVLRLNLATGAADTLGRVGEGPQEYEQPDQVFALPADSTLLVDLGRARFTVIDPQGTFRGGTSMAQVQEDGGVEIVMPRSVDGRGRIYYEDATGFGEGPRDSLRIARFDRETGESETLALAWLTPPIITRIEGGMRMRRVQMAPEDDWAVAADGSLAIVRADGYQVEWHFPDGRVVTGPPTEVETPRLSDEDKYASYEERGRAGLSRSVYAGDNGAVDVVMTRSSGGGGRARDEIDLKASEWAESYPPFRPDRARVAPAGELWVERWLHPDQAPRWDVFGRDGVKLGSVELPAYRRIVGWGTTADGAPAVYLIYIDEFDLKYLERYRIEG